MWEFLMLIQWMLWINEEENDAENFIIHECIYSNKHLKMNLMNHEGKLRFLSNFPLKLSKLYL